MAFTFEAHVHNKVVMTKPIFKTAAFAIAFTAQNKPPRKTMVENSKQKDIEKDMD